MSQLLASLVAPPPGLFDANCWIGAERYRPLLALEAVVQVPVWAAGWLKNEVQAMAVGELLYPIRPLKVPEFGVAKSSHVGTFAL